MDFLNVKNQQTPISSKFLRSTYARSYGSFSSIASDEIIINSKSLFDECGKNQLDIIEIPDKRLENGLSLICFKVYKKAKPQNHIIVFITKYNQQQITLVGFYKTKFIQKVHIQNQQQIPNIVKKWIQNINNKTGPNKKVIQFSKKSNLLIQQLNKKCSELLKTQKSELFAIQKLKTTKEYRELIQYQMQLNIEIQKLANLLTEYTGNIQKSNQKILPEILHIQQLKSQIQQMQYCYEQLKKKEINAKDYLNQFIQNQRDKVENMKIQTEQSFSEYISEMTKLKKLQNQKRFLII